jgi:hypothetical protein
MTTAQHTQECDDHRFCHHAATGDDADCICKQQPMFKEGDRVFSHYCMAWGSMVKAPAGNGGFRFSEVADKDGNKVLGDFYINQEGYRELGSPLELTLTIKAA